MQPFLEIPHIIENNEKKTLEVVDRIQPDQISNYYPGFYDGTIIVFKNGTSMFTPLSAGEVDQALTQYNRLLKRNVGTFGNIKITIDATS